MANYYQRKPAILHGKEIHIYLSKELMAIEVRMFLLRVDVIQINQSAQLNVFAFSIKKSGRSDREAKPMKGDSQVVFFSNLPRGGEKKMELLTIARRFGTVEKHLFLNDEVSLHIFKICPVSWVSFRAG